MHTHTHTKKKREGKRKIERQQPDLPPNTHTHTHAHRGKRRGQQSGGRELGGDMPVRNVNQPIIMENFNCNRIRKEPASSNVASALTLFSSCNFP